MPAATVATTSFSVTSELTYACTAASLFASVAYSPRETVTAPALTCSAAASTATLSTSTSGALTAEKSVIIVLCRNVANCPRVVVFLGLKAGAAGFVISKKSRTSIAVTSFSFRFR